MIILLSYSLITCVHLILGIALLKKYPTNDSHLNSFSVIVVSHNEEIMIIPLIESLLKLDYPQDKIEIILVDDNSTDKTWDIIHKYSQEFSFIKAIKTRKEFSAFRGKKAGLQSALDIARNDIIALTDADALVPPHWLRSLNNYFTGETGLVIGYIRGERIRGIIRYKRIFSSGLFASLCALGKAFSCSGGNLAIRKQALTDVGGYTSIKDFPSGDDKQILNLIKRTDYKIVYNSEVKVIERQRQLTSEQRYQQAIRHYGKVSVSSKLYQIGFLLTAIFYLSLPLIAFIQPLIILFFWLGNISFYTFSAFLHKERIYFIDFLLTIFYPYYMLYFSLIGTFKEAKWKK